MGGVFTLHFWKIEFFYPILHYCQFLQNQPPVENERSMKKTYVIFGFRIKNCKRSNVFFFILRSKVNFTVKIKKFFLKNREISIIFPLRSAISQQPLVRF